MICCLLFMKGSCPSASPRILESTLALDEAISVPSSGNQIDTDMEEVRDRGAIATRMRKDSSQNEKRDGAERMAVVGAQRPADFGHAA
jgi:hypothetical protein